MQTRLAALCERLIEAGWLAALVTAPLYFDALSSRVFEPDKISVVRAIAVFIAFFWAIRVLETFGRRAGGSRPAAEAASPAPGWRNWLLLPTGALLLAFVVASVLSVAPANSFFGSYQRLQGTLSLAAYMVIGLAVAANLRTRSQLDRLLTTVVLVSVPVSIYGVLQHLQRDPMPWTSDVTFRVSSTMGNSIFVAAYLIMALPPTLIRLVQSVDALRRPATARDETMPLLVAAGALLLQNILFFQLVMRFSTAQGVWWAALPMLSGFLVLCLPFWIPMSSRVAAWARVGGYTLALVLQAATIIFTPSGPWVGLLVGLAVVGLALASQRLDRRGMFAVAAASLVFGGSVVAMNVPNGPLSPLRSVPYLGRLGTLLEADSGTGKVRVLIWGATLELVKQHPSPGLEPDQYNALRPLVGFGPETLFFTFNKVYPPELANLELRTASPDRAHNETLQNLAEVGVFGTVAFWVLMNLVMFELLDAAGLVAAGHRRLMRLVTLVFGCLAVLGYLLYAGLRGLRPAAVEPAVALPALGLLGAVVAHFIELQFGIAIAASRTYFFVFAGAAVTLTLWRQAGGVAEAATSVAEPISAAAPVAEPEPEPAPVPVRALTPAPAFAASTVRRGSVNTGSSSRQRGGARRNAAGGGAGGGGSGSGGSAGGATPVSRQDPRLGDVRLSRLWAPMAFVFATVVLALLGGGFSPLMDPELGTLLGLFWLVGGMLCVAYPLVGASVSRLWQPSNAFFIVPLLIVAAAAQLFMAAPAEADILFKRGSAIGAQGSWLDGLPDMLAAVNLQPGEDFYYLHLGRAFLELSKAAAAKTDTNFTISGLNVLALRPDQLARLGPQDALRTAEVVLLQAQRLAPLNTDHYANLGRLNRFWVETGNPSRRDEMIKWYVKAVQMSPDSALLHDELAQAYLTANQPDLAEQEAQIARRIDPRYDSTYRTLLDIALARNDYDGMLGVFRAALAVRPDVLTDQRLQKWLSALIDAGRGDDLVAVYQAAIAATPPADAHPLYQPLGVIYSRLSRTQEAIAAFEQAVNLNPADWNTQRNLASMYTEQGRYDEALSAIRHAIVVAPNDRKGELQQYQASIEARKAEK